jgi:hypothetical protein
MIPSDTLKTVLDTVAATVTISEPVRVALTDTQKTLMDKPWFLALLTGGFTILGILFGQHLQRRTMKDIYDQQGWLNRDKELFVMRMNAYKGIAAALSEAYHVTLFKADRVNKQVFPSAYISYSYLKQWMNSVTKLVDRNLLLIDQETYQCFDKFNNMILTHLNEVETCRKRKNAWPLVSRDIGRRECGVIQNQQAEVIEACRKFIKTNYNIELEHVR